MNKLNIFNNLSTNKISTNRSSSYNIYPNKTKSSFKNSNIKLNEKYRRPMKKSSKLIKKTRLTKKKNSSPKIDLNLCNKSFTFGTKPSKELKDEIKSKSENKNKFISASKSDFLNKNVEKLVTSFLDKNKSILDTLYEKTKSVKFTINSINVNTIPNKIKIPNFLQLILDFTKYKINDKFIINNVLSISEIQDLFSNILKYVNNKHKLIKFLDEDESAHKVINYLFQLNNNSQIPNEILMKYVTLSKYSLLLNKFTKVKILNEIYQKMKKIITISFSFNLNDSNGIYHNVIYQNLNIYCDNSFTKSNIKRFANNVISRIVFFNYHLKTVKLPNNLTIFMTELKKEIKPSDITNSQNYARLYKKQKYTNSIYSSQNINTGLTNMRDIIIFRQEELMKTIIHELCHFHEMDFHTYPIEIEKKLIQDHHISPKNEYRINESINDFVANILHIVMIIHFENSKINKYNYYQQLKKHLNYHIHFCLLQMAKILVTFNFKSYQDFLKVSVNNNAKSIISKGFMSTFQNKKTLNDRMMDYNESENKRQRELKKRQDEFKKKKLGKNRNLDKNNISTNDKLFVQKTAVFSYYILKVYLFIGINEVFSKLLDSSLKFKSNKKNFKELYNIFKSSYKSNLLNQNVTSIIQKIIKLKEKERKGTKKDKKKYNSNSSNSIYNTELAKSMRMTCQKVNH